MSHLNAFLTIQHAGSAQKLWIFGATSVVFAVFGRLIRGVTTGGAAAGAVVCFALLCGAGVGAFAGLLTVFLLTWISTRIGYASKQRLGTAEARAGRNALQVLANLGTAAGCALAFVTIWPDRRLLIAMAAALAEAAADTVSSELGQAIGGTPRLITTWQPVAAGTDGGLTIAGSIAGAVAACAVASVFGTTKILGWAVVPVCAVAGFAGMIFDSLLGATLERRRVLGNNAVNFFSTMVAALTALMISY